jgi:hypothetical protein
MKKVFAIIATACCILTAILPIFTYRISADQIIGYAPLLAIYPSVIDQIRRGHFGYIPLLLVLIGMHLFLTLAPAWIAIRILMRRKQKGAERLKSANIRKNRPENG